MIQNLKKKKCLKYKRVHTTVGNVTMISINESDLNRKFLVKITKCKKIDTNKSKNLMITCVLHISSIKSINHSPPPLYSQNFSTFAIPGNFPEIPDSRE